MVAYLNSETLGAQAVAGEGRRVSAIGERTERIHGLAQHAEMLANRMEGLADRAFGPTPKDASSAGGINKAPHVPENALLELDRAIDRLLRGMDRLDSECGRIDAIA